MSDAAEELGYSITPTAMVFLPGLSFEEWEAAWHTARGLHESALFYVGDALIWGQENFGEQFSQVLDEYADESVKQAMWVCSRIPPARRHEGLRYSHHREVARLGEAEQDELLGLALANKWRTRDLIAEKKRRIAERAQQRGYPSNGGPEENPTGNDPVPDVTETAKTLDPPGNEPEPEEGTHQVRTLGDAEIRLSTAPMPPVTGGIDIDEVRACIGELRRISNDLAMGRLGWDEATALTLRIVAATGRDPGQAAKPVLFSVEAAEMLVPDGWTGQIEFTERVFFARKWSVHLRKGKTQEAIGYLPTFAAAMCEAALSAVVSEREFRSAAA